jgi:hypothetical protein
MLFQPRQATDEPATPQPPMSSQSSSQPECIEVQRPQHHLGLLFESIGELRVTDQPTTDNVMRLRLKLALLLQIDACLDVKQLVCLKRTDVVFTQAGMRLVSCGVDISRSNIPSLDTVATMEMYLKCMDDLRSVFRDTQMVNFVFISAVFMANVNGYSRISVGTLESQCDTFLIQRGLKHMYPDIPLASASHELSVTNDLQKAMSRYRRHAPLPYRIIVPMTRFQDTRNKTIVEILRCSVNVVTKISSTQ